MVIFLWKASRKEVVESSGQPRGHSKTLINLKHLSQALDWPLTQIIDFHSFHENFQSAASHPTAPLTDISQIAMKAIIIQWSLFDFSWLKTSSTRVTRSGWARSRARTFCGCCGVFRSPSTSLEAASVLLRSASSQTGSEGNTLDAQESTATILNGNYMFWMQWQLRTNICFVQEEVTDRNSSLHICRSSFVCRLPHDQLNGDAHSCSSRRWFWLR